MKKYITLFLLFSYQISITSIADTLLIEEVNTISDISKPTRGMTMNQVLSQFGQPLEKKDTVGEPPITQWVYADFSVYFERQWVIQAVVLKKRSNKSN